MNIPDLIREKFPELDHDRILCLMEFGSHLYGTYTEDSDRDYKGVFMPSQDQILLGKIPHSYHYSSGKDHDKNGSEDVDIEIYSLHYFMQLAYEGQTVAIDMLHAEFGFVFISDIWKALYRNRQQFHTRNLSAFIGYARKQAAKYGIKGSRLNDCKRVIDLFKSIDDQWIKLDVIWDNLPIGEHIHKLPPNPQDQSGQRIYQVVGKKFPERTPIQAVINTLSNFYRNYGARAKLAAENKGIDWKAVSHALRAAHQVKEILQTGDLHFPLRSAKELKAVKRGDYDYLTVVAPALEVLMERIEVLAEKSYLPNKVNRKFWDAWLMIVVTEYYGWELI